MAVAGDGDAPHRHLGHGHPQHGDGVSISIGHTRPSPWAPPSQALPRALRQPDQRGGLDEPRPPRSAPTSSGWDSTGWWVYVAGPLAGAAIAVIVISLLRGLPGAAEREAAEGGTLPLET